MPCIIKYTFFTKQTTTVLTNHAVIELQSYNYKSVYEATILYCVTVSIPNNDPCISLFPYVVPSKTSLVYCV